MNIVKNTNKLNFFHILCRKTLQDNLVDKIKFESLCNNYNNFVDEKKYDFF